jgi:hypothetical protein
MTGLYFRLDLDVLSIASLHARISHFDFDAILARPPIE